jgi:hypothetical protein
VLINQRTTNIPLRKGMLICLKAVMDGWNCLHDLMTSLVEFDRFLMPQGLALSEYSSNIQDDKDKHFD